MISEGECKTVPRVIQHSTLIALTWLPRSRPTESRPPSRGTDTKKEAVRPLPHNALMKQVEEEFEQLGNGFRQFIRSGRADLKSIRKRQPASKANGGDKKLRQQQIFAITRECRAVFRCFAVQPPIFGCLFPQKNCKNESQPRAAPPSR